ncbi:MAG: DUF4258 domain-containing protein [Candidatus Micrarchaeota archaeon]
MFLRLHLKGPLNYLLKASYNVLIVVVVKNTEFQDLLKEKKRNIYFTRHAQFRALQRLIPEKSIEDDLLSNSPTLVIEEDSDDPHKRKFSVYYLQFTGTYKKYIILINDEIRIITAMRTNKNLQSLMAGDKKWK